MRLEQLSGGRRRRSRPRPEEASRSFGKVNKPRSIPTTIAEPRFSLCSICALLIPRFSPTSPLPPLFLPTCASYPFSSSAKSSPLLLSKTFPLFFSVGEEVTQKEVSTTRRKAGVFTNTSWRNDRNVFFSYVQSSNTLYRELFVCNLVITRQRVNVYFSNVTENTVSLNFFAGQITFDDLPEARV